MLTTFDKALVPVVVALVVVGLGYFGVTGNTTVSDAVTAVVTAVLVWLVPNKQ